MTAVTVYESIDRQLEEVRVELQKITSDPNQINFDKIDENTDSILRFMPLVGPSQRITENFTELSQTVTNASENALSAINASRSEVQTEYETFRSTAQEKIDIIGNLEIDGKRLIETAAGRTLQKDFRSRSETEKTTADKWTNGTWYFGGAAIAVPILTIVLHIVAVLFNVLPELKTDIGLIGSQALLTIALGFMAKWCSKRAQRHLQEESKYHRLAVNLQIIEPLMSNVEKTVQDAARAAIAVKLITDQSGNDANTEFESSTLLESLKSAVSKSQ